MRGFRKQPWLATICRSVPRYAPRPKTLFDPATDVPTENEVVGEALVALQLEDLKEMGITSVGHRLTILKCVYDLKVKQDIPIESDNYVPQCKARLPSTHGLY